MNEKKKNIKENLIIVVEDKIAHFEKTNNDENVI